MLAARLPNAPPARSIGVDDQEGVRNAGFDAGLQVKLQVREHNRKY